MHFQNNAKYLFEPLFLDIVKLSGATSAENKEGINEFISSQINQIPHNEGASITFYSPVHLNNFANFPIFYVFWSKIRLFSWLKRVILLENYSQPFLGPDLLTYGNNITLSLQLMMWVAEVFAIIVSKNLSFNREIQKLIKFWCKNYRGCMTWASFTLAGIGSHIWRVTVVSISFC